MMFLFAKFKAYLIIGAMVILVVLALVFKIKSAGRMAERLEQAERINQALREKRRYEERVRAYPDDELVDELRNQRDELRRVLLSR